MKAFKKMALVIGSSTGVLALALTFYNSAALNNESFMNAALDLNNKRLDELHGNIVVGRMAASTNSWESLSNNEETNKVVVKSLKFSDSSKEIEELEPAIKEDLELTLSSVKLGSKAEGQPTKLTDLTEGSFSGTARTSNGFVDEVIVNLPDGRRIDIYSHKKMASNVFEYVDQESGEIRSAMMYESAKDTFTVMLTNDPLYPGSKLEFKTATGANLGNDSNLNWGMNDQNADTELANEQLDNNSNSSDYNNQDVDNSQNYSFGFNS